MTHIYIHSYAVCCEVDPEKAEAENKDGLLKISVPFKDLEFLIVDVKIEYFFFFFFFTVKMLDIQELITYKINIFILINKFKL